MRRLLIIHTEIPHPDNDPRTFNLVKGLSRKYEIVLLSTLFEGNKEEDIIRIKKYCTPLIKPVGSSSSLISPSRSELVLRHKHIIATLRKHAKQLIKEQDFDLVQVEHSYLGPVLEGVKTTAKKIMDFHNVHSFMRCSPLERLLRRKDEKKLRKIYDVALCCSAIDKKRLTSLGWEKIFVVPNGVDTKYYTFMSKESVKPSLLFVGQLNYKPNFESMKYFFNEIYPLFEQKMRVEIIGNYDPTLFKEEKKLAGVVFHGYVKDIRSHFKNSILFCSLLDGGGTRIKILTGFAAGSPVVSTSKGAEGIECEDEKNILIADSPEEFVKNIHRLRDEPQLYSEIQKNALRIVKEKYDWEVITKKYSEYLHRSQSLPFPLQVN